MTTPHNRWQSYDSTEPVLVWTLAVPAPPGTRRAVIDEVLAAGRDSGVLIAEDGAVVDDGGLPWEDALYGGDPVPFSSRVFVRDRTGAIVERQSSDAGALLRSLEPLEDAYQRRFAAAHPFAGAWTSTSERTVSVHVAFFTTLWFEAEDAALLARNQPRLLAFRDALLAIAKRRGGRLLAPVSPPTTT